MGTKIKHLLATLLYTIGMSRIIFWLFLKLAPRHIRVINYHGTPKSEKVNFENQLRFYQKYYCNVAFNDLKEFISTGKWDKPKPGLIISFDDGKRNHYDIAKNLLEKYGYTGWFMIPAGLIDMTIEEQKVFVGNDTVLTNEYSGERCLMSWEEIKNLSSNHIIGSHTMTHHRMRYDDSPAKLQMEITESKTLLENKINQHVYIFCWVGGEEKHYTQKAAKAIKEAGYKLSFMTNTFPVLTGQNPFQIQRSNIETDNSLALVIFQLSGIMDILYYPKRKRISKLLEN